MCKVCGQNPLGLDQREHQAENHHPAAGPRESTEYTVDKQGWRKGHYGGQHPEGRWRGDFVDTLHDTLDIVAVFFLLSVGALAHDNGVVDHDAQYDNESEDTDHVQAGVDVGRVDHGHCAEEADRNAQHHPECEFDLQK